MHVYSEYNLRTVKLLKGMLNAITYISSKPHLSLHPYISRTGTLHYIIQQLLAPTLVSISLSVIIYHIEGYQSSV